MDFRITLEWNEECGLFLRDMYSFRESIEKYFQEKKYGTSITTVWILLNILGYDVKQRKLYKKTENRIGYDILLDFFLIKNVEKEEKKKIIKSQIKKITEQTFEKYKFKDFDKKAFLIDFTNIVESIKW